MFLALTLDAYPPTMSPPSVEYVSVSSWPSAFGRLEDGIRCGDLVIRLSEQGADAEPYGEQPDPELPIDVTLVSDNKGEGGQWYQTFVFRIEPAGTLADISTIVYGNESHVNEIFAIVQKRNPSVTSPALVQAGQEIEMTVDASRIHVLKTIIPGATQDALTRVYFNGVKEIFPGRSGSAVERVVEFPADAPVDSFVLKRDEQEVSVPRGNKLVEYRYEQGDNFEETVAAAYGKLSTRAIQDFERQTRWSFDRWPPANGDTSEAIISTTRPYDDESFEPLRISLPDPVADARFQELLSQRAQAGVYPVKQPPSGITYRVAVVDSSVTARQVARLLYNSDARYLEIAEAAGIKIETKDMEDLPSDFDMSLIGRSFDIQVDFAEEGYILEEGPGDGETVVKVTKLLNGAVIEERKEAEKGLQGVHRIVHYPNGYRRLVYKPDDTLVAFFDFLYFTMKLGQVDDEEDRRAFVATMLWNWLRDIPRSPGDVAEQLTLRDDARGKLMEALVWRREHIGLAEMALYRWWTINPCLALLTLVFGASMVFMVMVILIRRVVAQRYSG